VNALLSQGVGLRKFRQVSSPGGGGGVLLGWLVWGWGGGGFGGGGGGGGGGVLWGGGVGVWGWVVGVWCGGCVVGGGGGGCGVLLIGFVFCGLMVPLGVFLVGGDGVLLVVGRLLGCGCFGLGGGWCGCFGGVLCTVPKTPSKKFSRSDANL